MAWPCSRGTTSPRIAGTAAGIRNAERLERLRDGLRSGPALCRSRRLKCRSCHRGGPGAASGCRGPARLPALYPWPGTLPSRALRRCDPIPGTVDEGRAWLVGHRVGLGRPALAHHRLGHDQQAKDWLRKVDDFTREQEPLNPERGVAHRFMGIWWDWVELDLLRREADTLMKANPIGSDAAP